MRRGNTGVICLIVILFIAVIILALFIAWEKLNNNNNVVQNNNGQQSGVNAKVDLTANELVKIEEFINKGENNPFAIITYSSPSDLFNNKNNEATTFYLKYAIQLSEYSEKLTKDQLALVYGGEVPPVTIYGTLLANIHKFLQSKMNYTYSEQTIKNNFIVNEKINMYITMVSDSIYCELDVLSGYKLNGKIHITLTDNRTLTLTEQNGNYCFYTCEGLDM